MTPYRCNLVIPGFPKCGTTSFYKYLQQHRDICLGRPKENNYFSVGKIWQRGASYHNQLFKGEREDYRYYCDVSTSYSAYAPAIERIAESLDRPRIILLLRDPVERLLSQYRWLYRLGHEKRPFKRAIRESEQPFDPDHGFDGNYAAYSAFSSYSKYVPLWQARFGTSNVLLIQSERLRDNPKEVLAEVFQFLELDPLAEIERVNVNVTKDTRSLHQPSWALAARRFAPLRIRAIGLRVPFARAIWRSLSAPRKIEPPPISAEERAMIERRLVDERRYYRDLLAREMP